MGEQGRTHPGQVRVHGRRAEGRRAGIQEGTVRRGLGGDREVRGLPG